MNFLLPLVLRHYCVPAVLPKGNRLFHSYTKFLSFLMCFKECLDLVFMRESILKESYFHLLKQQLYSIIERSSENNRTERVSLCSFCSIRPFVDIEANYVSYCQTHFAFGRKFYGHVVTAGRKSVHLLLILFHCWIK